MEWLKSVCSIRTLFAPGNQARIMLLSAM